MKESVCQGKNLAAGSFFISQGLPPRRTAAEHIQGNNGDSDCNTKAASLSRFPVIHKQGNYERR